MATARTPSVAGSDAQSRPSRPSTSATATTATAGGKSGLRHAPPADSKYSISAVLAEPVGSSSLLPSLSSLPSASSYLPSQLSALSTTFTSAGTLPKAASGAKSVAQRRSQAPPIHVTELRKVHRAEFDGYLREIADDFDRWQRESRSARDGAGADSQGQGRQGPGLVVGSGEEGSDTGGRSGLDVSSPLLVRSPALPPPVLPTELLPALDDVPQIFFDSAFDLANPRTFDLVTERIQLSPHPSPNLSLPDRPTSTATTSDAALDHVPGLGPHTLNELAADQVLQEKLSHYTAIIESHLVREIGLRSSSFFAALSNLQSLHSEGEAALHKIAELQSALKASEGGVGASAQHGLQVLRAQARRRGLERIEEAVRAVEEVWTAVEGVKELVENGEWDGALEVSEQVEDAYYGSTSAASPVSNDTAAISPLSAPPSSPRRVAPAHPINLTKLRALSSLPTKLALLRAQIAKSLEGELTSVLEHELMVGIDEHVQLARHGKRWKGKAKATAQELVLASPSGALHSVPEDEDSAISHQDGPDGPKEPAPENLALERTLERVRPVVSALVRAGGLDSAVLAWRENALREVRALVREHLPTAETPTAEDEDHFARVTSRNGGRGTSVDLGTISEKSVSLAKKLRALPHEAFVDLARNTYAGLLACIELVDLQARVLLELWESSRKAEQQRRARRRSRDTRRPNGSAGDEDARGPSPTSSTAGASLAVPGSAVELAVAKGSAPADSSHSSASEDASSLGTDVSDVVHAVAELANVRFSKVIGVRTEVHAHLALADFVEVFDLSWAFVVACERVCQRMIVGLRGAMVSQAKSFLQMFHQRQITENARVVEEEQWAAVEVPPSVQANIQLIVESATSDPNEVLLGERRAARLAASTNGGHEPSTDETQPAAAAEAAKQIDIEGKQFFSVSAGLVTIAVLVEYLKVLANVPLLTTDAMSKIIEFMKVFNSRTCQVVLGAGAMRSAGLKNITAKHLALASQALSIMIALIPYIREAVRRHLNPKQAVMLTEFDKLKRDYQEHQYEIHAKLVAIMSDRLQVHSRTLEGIDLEEPAPRGPDTPNAYMEALVKEHNTLHKVLSRFLANETVAAIMGEVFAALDERLGEVFARLEPKSQTAKDRMLVDVRYLRERLGALKGVEGNGPGKALEELVAAKSVPDPPNPNPAPTTSTVSQSPAPAPALTLAPEPTPAADKPSLPPRSSSIPPPSNPPDDPPPSAAEAPASGADDSVTMDETTSDPSTSLPSRPAASPNPDSPALPPHPTTSSTAPSNSQQKKKKSLAERLAESMGRKAAHAEPRTTPAQAEATEPPPIPVAIDVSAQDASSNNGTTVPEVMPTASSAGDLTPLALERAFENGAGVDTPALEKALQLEGIQLIGGGLATPARKELEEIEKAIEREVEGAKMEEDQDAVAALESLTQEDLPSGKVVDAVVEQRESAATASQDAAVDGSVEPSAEAVDGAGDPPATKEEPSVAPAPDELVDKDNDGSEGFDEPSSSVEPVGINGDERASETVEPRAPQDTPAPAPADPGSLGMPDPLQNEELGGDQLSHSPRDVSGGHPSVVDDGPNSIPANVASAAAEQVPLPTDTMDEEPRTEAMKPTFDAQTQDVAQVAVPEALAPVAPAPVIPSTEGAVALPDEAPADEVVAQPTPSKTESPPAPEVEPSPAPHDKPASDASPAESPTAQVAAISADSSAPSSALAAASPESTAPPRRKTLKERLAEAARRGSSGGSVSSIASPPSSPMRDSSAAPTTSAVGVLLDNGSATQQGTAAVVASPESATSALPGDAPAPGDSGAPPTNAVSTPESGRNGGAGDKVDAKEEKLALPSEVEEEESTFL